VDDSTYLTRLDALARTWQRWAAVGRDAEPHEWAAPSRCEGWDVACLFAHHSLFPLAFSKPAPAAPGRTNDDEPGRLTAPQILREFNRREGAAHSMAPAVADRARADALRLSRRELVRRFSMDGHQAVNALRRTDAGTLMAWPRTKGLTPLREAVRLILLESTVHLLDVLRALDMEPVVAAGALRESAALLAETAPLVEFVEAAAGRSATNPLPVLR
jgi:hypothetical protein